MTQATLEQVRDTRDGPAEEAWQTYRKKAVRAAVDRLPPAQRQALSLAFFDELSHDQVAAALKLPVGTVKTRIRAAVHKLRFMLAPLGVAAVAIAVLVGGGIRFELQRLAQMRTDRALSMVTASDITTLHVPPAPGADPATHGSYRGRPGTPIGVLALHNFTPAAPGMWYQAWVWTRGAWTSMGTAQIDAAGNAVLVSEGPAFTALPAEIEVTLESHGGSPAPSASVIIHYTGQ